MPRLMLTDEHWSKLRTILLEHGIYDKPTLRKTMAVDTHGLPIEFDITGGEVHDCKAAPEFFAKLPKVMTVKNFAIWFALNHQCQLFQEKVIQR